MSKQKLFRTRGRLLINTSRLGTSRSKPQIAPNNEPHASECGCVSCRITAMTDEAIERQLGELTADRDGLTPTPGVLGNSQSKRSVRGPLMPTRGVLAEGDA